VSETAPRIAVIVPCYDDGATVGETLASLEEPEPLELVVVDDGSSDERTRELLARLESDGLRVVRHEQNLGLPAARTTGLRATRAPFVFPLDADDLAVPGSLSKMADLLERTPSADACYGDWMQFGAFDKVCRVPRTFDPYTVAFRNRYPVASLFRRSFLELVGGWQRVGGMVGYEDWDLWMTLAERGGTAVFIDNVLAVRYRVHGVRMLRSAARNHGALYAELKARHPQLFAELAGHRRRSPLSRLDRTLYPVLFGGRRPTGLKRRAEELRGRLRRARRRSRTGGARPQSPP
jgi:glycosyltransferase involved in cell wall biosynthesis